MREHLLRVTIKECDVQTFRVSGSGGQNRDKRDTGVRVIHRPSGAVGESREERKQIRNKRTAFRRMAESEEFQTWARMTALKIRSVEEVVDEQMHPDNLKVEYPA